MNVPCIHCDPGPRNPVIICIKYAGLSLTLNIGSLGANSRMFNVEWKTAWMPLQLVANLLSKAKKWRGLPGTRSYKQGVSNALWMWDIVSILWATKRVTPSKHVVWPARVGVSQESFVCLICLLAYRHPLVSAGSSSVGSSSAGSSSATGRHSL